MRKFKRILIGFLGCMMLGGLTHVYAAPTDSNSSMRRVSGEIEWIDVKQGKLQLKSDVGQDTKGISEYRLNLQETRVTDPSDKKFLVVKDLRAGQHVTLELVDPPRDESDITMVRKIIADPYVEPSYEEVTGELEAIDTRAGTLVVDQKPLPSDGKKGDLVYFVFEPRSIVVMRAPNAQPVELMLKPGDPLRVAYVMRDGKRHARAITLLSEATETSSTTTTTTTSTTVVQ